MTDQLWEGLNSLGRYSKLQSSNSMQQSRLNGWLNGGEVGGQIGGQIGGDDSPA